MWSHFRGLFTDMLIWLSVYFFIMQPEHTFGSFMLSSSWMERLQLSECRFPEKPLSVEVIKVNLILMYTWSREGVSNFTYERWEELRRKERDREGRRERGRKKGKEWREEGKKEGKERRRAVRTVRGEKKALTIKPQGCGCLWQEDTIVSDEDFATGGKLLLVDSENYTVLTEHWTYSRLQVLKYAIWYFLGKVLHYINLCLRAFSRSGCRLKSRVGGDIAFTSIIMQICLRLCLRFKIFSSL